MSSARRRHVAGEATRILLLTTAERLFAEHGVEAVTVRQIQSEAGQANASVITYHFGSKEGLVHELIRWRNGVLDERRASHLAALSDKEDPRNVVWLLVAPFVESIRSGEMFVPFLARLSDNPRAHARYWPTDLADWTEESMQDILGTTLAHMPQRLRRGRAVQLYNSILNLLGEQMRAGHEITELQLNNYVDAWVGMLTAPVSTETLRLTE